MECEGGCAASTTISVARCQTWHWHYAQTPATGSPFAGNRFFFVFHSFFGRLCGNAIAARGSRLGVCGVCWVAVVCMRRCQVFRFG